MNDNISKENVSQNEKQFSKQNNQQNTKPLSDRIDEKIERNETPDGRTLKKTGMDLIEEKTDFPAIYAVSIIAACGFIVLLGYLQMHLTDVICIVFPVYWSIKALENPSVSEEQQWETYWIIYFINLIPDMILPKLLAKIPYYYFIKYCFFVWLFMPNTMGALFLHDKVFRRIFGPINIRFRKITGKIRSKITFYLDKIKFNPEDNVEEVSQQPLNEQMFENKPQKQSDIANQTADLKDQTGHFTQDTKNLNRNEPLDNQNIKTRQNLQQDTDMSNEKNRSTNKPSGSETRDTSNIQHKEKDFHKLLKMDQNLTDTNINQKGKENINLNRDTRMKETM